MSPSAFANEQLGLLRRAFFADAIDSQFYQERDLLLQAIAFPAAHLKERYGIVRIGRSDEEAQRLYRLVLKTVTDTIIEKGNLAKIERFSVYFLHCVQEHLRYHGEEYFKRAVHARSAEDALPSVLGKVGVG